jgi:hypothetical protein
MDWRGGGIGGSPGEVCVGLAGSPESPVLVSHGGAGEFDAGAAGGNSGEVGEYSGESGEYAGDVGEYGEVGEYAGDVGEYAGDDMKCNGETGLYL